MLSGNHEPKAKMDKNRRHVMTDTFKKAKGQRVFLLTAEFPFLVIGKIKKIEDDYVYVKVETTLIDPLEDQTCCIHLERIQVFYIEKKGSPIPRIDNSWCHRNRGDLK